MRLGIMNILFAIFHLFPMHMDHFVASLEFYFLCVCACVYLFVRVSPLLHIMPFDKCIV